MPFLTGTDTGFAITPYGEWHARELELFVDDLGFTPAAALRAATEVNARFMAECADIGALEPGKRGRFHRVGRFAPRRYPDPAGQVAAARGLYRRQWRSVCADRPYDPRRVTDFALTNWTDLYTQARVAELYPDRRQRLEAAE